MRAGRSILGECIAVVRYRRIFATLRHTALLLVGLCIAAAAMADMGFAEYLDGLRLAADFVALLWGAFLMCVGLWRLL